MVALATACAAPPASAHGFGERYDLPLPLGLYLAGTAAAVVVSFVVFALFVRQVPRAEAYRRVDLGPVGALIAWPAPALRLVSLALFITIVLAGFLGNQNPYRNIAPTLVWVIGWVGLAYVSAFVGNVWALVNPWRTAFDTAEWLCRRLAGHDLAMRRPYPAALGVWPAFVLLLAFSWIELVYPSPAVPLHIAWLAIGYSLVTFAGLFVFGATWLAHGEVFTLVFGTFARFAPTEAAATAGPATPDSSGPGSTRASSKNFFDSKGWIAGSSPAMTTDGSMPPRQLALRPFGAGLLDSGSVSTSMMAFVLLLLSTVLYDGLIATPEWSNLESAAVAALPISRDLAFLAIRSLGLVALWLVFFGAYLVAGAGMSAAAGGRLPPLAIARTFAFTLVPIAIGYHLAHYLTFLLIQGQYIIPLASDPFGFGWDMFGTAGHRVDIAIVDARFAWYAAVTAIVLGHIAAVYLAHRKAMQVFEARRTALRSQLPLTALMVVYTFVSLSILAEPIVARRAPAQPSLTADVAVPADAVLPEAGSGRLQPVGPDKRARQKLTYRALASAFHDGSRMDVADLLYATMFAYRWSANDPAAGHYDPAVAAATRTMRQNLVGFRVVGSDTASKSFRIGDVEFVRQLYAVEVYLAAPPVEPEQDAALAPPWSTLPWHLIVLMEEAVMRGWAAFSQDEAARRGTEWLDLVRSETLKQRLAGLVDEFARAGYRPDILASLVSEADARRRWAALAAFHNEHGHFLVANGPYRLKGWSSDRATLEAFRDLTYPLGVGSYDAYAIPRRGFITKVERGSDEIRLSGDVELVMKHQRSYDIVRQPLPSVPRDVLRRAAPECRYMVTDSLGRVVLAGQAALAEDAMFHIDVRGKLPPGDFTLLAHIVVSGNAMNPEIQRIPITVAQHP